MGSIVNMVEHDFSKEVEEIVANGEKGEEHPYIQAVLTLCERHGIDPESAARLLSKPICENLKAEFESLHMVRGKRKKSKLPLDEN